MFEFRRGLGVLVLAMACGTVAAADPSENVRSGQVDFRPAADEAKLPELFRLPASQFSFEQKPIETSSKVFSISTVTFPSSLVTPQANNNTVHCEYFQPLAPGKHPGVIVLHILGGDFPLSRLFCRSLAQHGTAALFLKMPYYGPRRQPDSPARMVSLDPEETVRGMTQAVLDVRRGDGLARRARRNRSRATGNHGHQPGRDYQRAGGHGRAAAEERLPDSGRRRHRRSGLGSARAGESCAKVGWPKGATSNR